MVKGTIVKLTKFKYNKVIAYAVDKDPVYFLSV